jgi:type III secretory pathway component EscS
MPLVFIRSLEFTHWAEYFLIPFVVASVVVLALSGRKRLSGLRAYLIRFGAALLIAITMGLYLESPWLGTIMVSTATGLLFRYW